MPPRAKPPCGRAYYMRFLRAQWKKDLKRIETHLNSVVHDQRRITFAAQDMLVKERDRLRRGLGRAPKHVEQASTSLTDSVGNAGALGSITSIAQVHLTYSLICSYSFPYLQVDSKNGDGDIMGSKIF